MIWPFSKREKPIKELPGFTDPGHHWDATQQEHDGMPNVIRINQSANDWIAHSMLPQRWQMTIPIKAPNSLGLPDYEESQEIESIEQLLVSQVQRFATGIHVLVISNAKRRTHFFQMTAESELKKLEEAMQPVVSHELSFSAEPDSEWNLYKRMRRR